MTGLLLILKLFSGLILLFILGRTIGHLFKLDKYYEDIHKNKNENIKRGGNENDQNCPNKIIINKIQ
jgi:hypothetical protein